MGIGISKAFFLRYIILAPMAYCIFLLLASNDVNVRMAAIIALIVLEQVRDWSLLATARALAKGNKPS
ncbi:MAG: hypothetical protein NTX79_02270 [Candidatus Micrarchaeota archaeon]|nr:hypothetical protein [Candidatus Micrarchaeota archaeon]